MLFEPASAAGSPFSVCFSHITWSGVGGQVVTKFLLPASPYMGIMYITCNACTRTLISGHVLASNSS